MHCFSLFVENSIYWQLPGEKLLSRLDTSMSGLSTAEAKDRLSKYGKNEIAKAARTWLKILISQFTSPLIVVLIVAAILSFFVADTVDSLIIIAIVLVNGLLGFFQEYKSAETVEKLKQYISYRAKVLRDSREIEINANELVPGDIVYLETGDKVPADIRLLDANNFSVDESLLTGEPYPVIKNSKVLEQERPLVQETSNIAFMGTIVSDGEATGVVISTGNSTEFGKTAALMREVESESDFQKNIRKFGKTLTNIIVTVVLLIFFVNTFLGKQWLDSFLFAVALAVGIIPESLPIIITISLSIGANILAKKNVVVKKLVSIEDLGNVDILCTDKTGTLTENRITLENAIDINGKKIPELVEYGILCNSAVELKGNPIDVAIHQYAKQNKISAKEFVKLADVPFDYHRRMMSALVQAKNKHLMITKGAVESVLKACTHIKVGKFTVPVKKFASAILEQNQELGNHGFRVIGVAVKDTAKTSIAKSDETAMTFIGFLVFIDPPKKSAKESLERAKHLGMQIKVLTGDEPHTTIAIARQVGLEVDATRVMTGEQIEKMSEQELKSLADETIIFARINPEHKYRIIKALRDNGHIVAYLGDGANDAPALKEADVGISVDSGVDVAKDAADIVLLRKSMDVVLTGVREGRIIFSNIVKYIVNTISANFGNMGTLGIVSPFLPFFPLLPTQILLNNALSDTPMMAVATDTVDDSELKKPRRWNIKHIVKLCAFLGAISSIFDFITIFVLLFVLNAGADMFRTAWFLESGLSEIIIVFAVRSRKPFFLSKLPSKPLILVSLATIAFTLFIVQFSPIGQLFKFVPLPLGLLGAIGLILLAYFAVTEVAKHLYYRYLQKDML